MHREGMVEIATQALVHLTFRDVENKRRLGGWDSSQAADGSSASTHTNSSSSSSSSSSGSGSGSGGDNNNNIGGSTSSSGSVSSGSSGARARASVDAAMTQAVFPTLVQVTLP